MADLFGVWVPDEWIEEVFETCKAAPQHTYMFLTKNPQRYLDLEAEKKLPWEDNFWFGTSITNPNTVYAWFMEKKFHWFISIEPILEDLGDFGNDVMPEWIIVGAETGNRKGKVVPDRIWIENIVEQCRQHEIPLFMKSSLADIWGEALIQEFPARMKEGEK
jgi:protein gp37